MEFEEVCASLGWVGTLVQFGPEAGAFRTPQRRVSKRWFVRFLLPSLVRFCWPLLSSCVLVRCDCDACGGDASKCSSTATQRRHVPLEVAAGHVELSFNESNCNLWERVKIYGEKCVDRDAHVFRACILEQSEDGVVLKVSFFCVE